MLVLTSSFNIYRLSILAVLSIVILLEGCVIGHDFLLLKISDIMVKMKCNTLNALLIWQQFKKDFECSYNYSLPRINDNKCYEQWRFSLVLIKKSY